MAATQATLVVNPPQSPYRRITLSNILAVWRYGLLRAQFRNLDAGLFYVGSGYDIRIDADAKVHFGRGVQLMRDFSAHFGGKVSFGDGVFFNRGCSLIVLNSLTVGEHTIFGERVSIHDENHVMHGSGPIHTRGLTTAPISIGSHVWVGAKATILSGVTIGDNAVIGANAVVTHDIPANSVAVGVPARIIRQI